MVLVRILMSKSGFEDIDVKGQPSFLFNNNSYCYKKAIQYIVYIIVKVLINR
jgi:hypothetical protein